VKLEKTSILSTKKTTDTDYIRWQLLNSTLRART